jgi:hypothetical protein
MAAAVSRNGEGAAAAAARISSDDIAEAKAN